MYNMKLTFVISLCILSLFSYACVASDYFPTSITDITSTHSDQPISCLATQDQSGTKDNWNKYIEFDAVSKAYSGIIHFTVPAQAITGATLTVNFRGQPYADQGWKFELLLNTNNWLLVGTTNPNTAGWGSWNLFTFTIPSSTDFSHVIGAQNDVQLRFSATKALDAGQLDYVKLSLTSSSSTSTSTTGSPTPAPTPAPTSSPTSAPPTPTPKPTRQPTTSPNSVHVNLRILVLSANLKAAGGLDLVNLTFDSVGMPYDVVEVAAATSLDSYLSTSGTGKYSGIVSIKKTLLSAAQQTSIINYQKHFGVKWAIIGSSPAGLPGLSAGTTTSTKGTLTLASQFYAYSHPLQHSVSVDTKHSTAWEDLAPASITPATITDSSIATPAIWYNGNQVAVAALHMTDGTQQLHYFIAQSSKYFFSRVFSVILLNWLSPAGLFVGYRRHTLAVQPDDLFLASNLWDPSTHKNPLSNDLIYRITASDLQNAADFLNTINPTLPSGSYVTIEWPFNGAGTTWYAQPDPLFAKAKALQNHFYFVSHTWDHPCDFDTATYAEVNTELKNNIDFTPSFLTNGLNSSRFTDDALVNPCITGLFNGNCLRAMSDNGIRYCVGDNSVKKLVPANKYHPITTTVATNGYAGILIIPREAYDIDYDNSVPAELVDQFNTENNLKYTFEQIMQLQVDYAMEKKTGFIHDAFMFHQANVRFFSYNDPQTGTTRSVSLTTLWMERVIKQTLAYYDLPIVSPKFDAMAKIWLDRQAADNCGFNADLEINNGQLIAIHATSTNTCEIPLSGLALSGSNVRVEHAGSEVTSFVSMTASSPLTLALSTPISL
eukprot:Phypoly_transcript_02593.p1 GENE.Phypoly_transcript_02593~~Phypoly_transcript_02593.p1  ORF type:complete len:829 (+),score=203.62 Phypoly_transcript_02593:53-2539(+)